MADKDVCPSCPASYTWNQESFANLGCLLLTILPLAAFILFWLFLFFGLFFR